MLLLRQVRIRQLASGYQHSKTLSINWCARAAYSTNKNDCKDDGGNKSVADMLKTNPSALVSKMRDYVGKSPWMYQLAIGSTVGMMSGITITKIGRPVALGAGLVIILYEIAFRQKYIATDWEEIRKKAMKNSEGLSKYKASIPNAIESVSKFSRTNSCFTAGFIGGLLIGLAL